MADAMECSNVEYVDHRVGRRERWPARSLGKECASRKPRLKIADAAHLPGGESRSAVSSSPGRSGAPVA